MGNDQAKNLRELMKNQVKCRTLLFASGRDKVGKTTLVTNLASLLSRNEYKTIILDSGSGFFRTDVLLNTRPKYGTLHMIECELPIEESLVNVCDKLDIVYMREVFEKVKTSIELKEKLNVFLIKLRETYDFILIDLEELDIASLVDLVDRETQFLFVLSSENLKCLKPTYSLVKEIEQETEIKEISLILNKIKNDNLKEEISQRLKIACDKFLGVKVVNLGYISNSIKVPESFRRQTPITVLDEDCEVSDDIKDLFSNIILN